MKGRIWTVPNQITFLRLGFLPFFLILLAYDHYRWALLVLVVAGLSDGIDGVLARSLNQRSALGAYLDPIADKLLLSSSFVLLAFKHKLAWWLTIIVLSRDVLILIVAVVILLVSGYRPFPPSIFGKLTTATEIILVPPRLDKDLACAGFESSRKIIDVPFPLFLTHSLRVGFLSSLDRIVNQP